MKITIRRYISKSNLRPYNSEGTATPIYVKQFGVNTFGSNRSSMRLLSNCVTATFRFGSYRTFSVGP